MKVSRFLQDSGVEERAANLRPKILIAFIITMVAVAVFWVFRLACVAKVGFWYTIWNALYHISRGVAVVLLLALIVIWLYLFLYSIWDKFSPRGNFKAPQGKRNPNSTQKPEPGDYDFKPGFGDLSDFD